MMNLLDGDAERRMEPNLGKLFIGGVSWDTNEDRLRDYFSKYGEVVEAVIMKDRLTGRARGFGFIVFQDPAVAERVMMEKHTIDGRMVEAKKAVPREDQHIINRHSSGVHGSPVPAHTRKIFVGGLASTVTETDFRKYFEQFGTITDVVVMYDHNTQRPRGFGFITYDSEDAVDKVLVKTFHELNGKMVEVKKAVPKELSPGPTMRSPIGGYNHSLNRVNSFLNVYTQGYNPSFTSGYNTGMDARFGPLPSARNGVSPFNPTGYGMGINFKTGMSPSFDGNTIYNGLGYGRGVSPYYIRNSSRYNSPIGHGGSNIGVGSVFRSPAHKVWGNGGLNYASGSETSNDFLGSASGNFGGFGSHGMNWGISNSPVSAQGGGSISGYASVSLGNGGGDNSLGLGGSSHSRSSSTGADANKTFGGSTDEYDGLYTDLYGANSIYGDPTWCSASSELEGSGPFGYAFGSAASDVTVKGTVGYMEAYSVANRQPHRGIAV